MLHTVLCVLGLRDQGVQFTQVGSHFLAEIDLFRLDAAVRGLISDIRDRVIRRFHCHHFIRLWFLLVFLLRIGIRLLGLVTRSSAA